MNGTIKLWIRKEFETLRLNNQRLERRFMKTMSDLSEQPNKSIWLASGSRGNAKAVYRMLKNEDITKEKILSAHREATTGRSDEGNVLLAVQDTMSVNYAGHEKTEGMGYNCEQTLGINTHSCVLVTPEGIPMGLASQSVSTRVEAADKRESKSKKRLRPIEEKESYRWLETMNTAAQNAPSGAELIHIADREGDIYELYELAYRTGQKFVIRATHDRITTENEHIMAEIERVSPSGKMKATIPANRQKKAKEREAILTIRYSSFNVKKPQIRYNDKDMESSLSLNLVSLREENPPEGSDAVEWLLMTNLKLENANDAMRVAEYYKQRWKIERFHYILKSGCEIEKIQQRSVDSIELVILLYSIISIHIMQLTFISRQYPHMPCDLIFATNEWITLYRAANRTAVSPDIPYSISDAVRYVAQLGGFVGAPSDGPPGLKVIWLGLNALYILIAYREFI